MRGSFWLSDQQWAAIEPQLPYFAASKRREDDRRIISGILHVLQSGCRWQGHRNRSLSTPPTSRHIAAPAVEKEGLCSGHRPHKGRTQHQGSCHERRTLPAFGLLSHARPDRRHQGRRHARRASAENAYLLADKAYDADHWRACLLRQNIQLVIPNKVNRKQPHPFDRERYKDRDAIERIAASPYRT
jgi:transposase